MSALKGLSELRRLEVRFEELTVGLNDLSTPPKRFTVQRKQEVLLRLLKGEPLEALSRKFSVPATPLSMA